MQRLAPVLGRVVVAIAVLAVAAACSSSKKSSTPPTTTSTTSSTVSSIPTSSTTAGSSTTTTGAGPTTTTAGSVTTVVNDGPTISGFTASPPSPVSCNAPTMIQLKWTSTRATSVALSIDGKLFAAYGGGPQDHLEYLACDGKSHTYLLTALGQGRTATAAKIVASNKVS